MSARLQELITKMMISGPEVDAIDEYERLLRDEENTFIKQHATEALISSLVIHSVELTRAERLCRDLVAQDPQAHLVELLATILMQQGREVEARTLKEQSRQKMSELLGP